MGSGRLQNYCLKHYNNSLTTDSFAILCAVSSLLGKQDGKFKLITSEQIQCRMNGFKS